MKKRLLSLVSIFALNFSSSINSLLPTNNIKTSNSIKNYRRYINGNVGINRQDSFNGTLTDFSSISRRQIVLVRWRDYWTFWSEFTREFRLVDFIGNSFLKITVFGKTFSINSINSHIRFQTEKIGNKLDPNNPQYRFSKSEKRFLAHASIELQIYVYRDDNYIYLNYGINASANWGTQGLHFHIKLDKLLIF